MWQDPFIAAQLELHDRILLRLRRGVRDTDNLSGVARESDDDIIYRLDAVAEEDLLRDVTEIFAPLGGVRLVCEGLAAHRDAASRARNDLPILILDPVDGTRNLMYDKRSAWILSAMTDPDPGPAATCRHLVTAVQTEIPTSRSHLSDQLVARRSRGALARSRNLCDGTARSFDLTPDDATSIDGGFATICRFFPPDRDKLAALDDALLARLLGPPDGRATVFEDQYMCTGGLLYQLMTGRDRFVADLRGITGKRRRRLGLVPGMACHPYDLCTSLIAEEAGVLITDESGSTLNFPLTTRHDVSWIGYSSPAIRDQVEEILLELIPHHLGIAGQD